MDYPKSTPGVGLVGGKFADENPSSGQIGSLIPAAWGNAVTDELLAVLRAAGVAPAEGDNNQLARVIATKATTLAGYGITDALRVGSPSDQRPELYTNKTGGESGSGTGGALMIREVMLAGSTTTDYSYAPRILFHWSGVVEGALGMGASGRLAWNSTPVLLAGGAEIGAKADKSTTLAGYGITDAYTKAQADNALVGKADKATTLGGYGITDAYTKTQVDNALAGKASKATTLAGYGITDALRVGPPSDQRPTLYTNTTGGESGSGTGGALMIREVQLAGSAVTDYSYAPRILFHWSGVAEGSLGMGASGRLAWNSAPVLLAGGAEINAKADKATTLAGYGIAAASQSEAELGADTTKPMTALRVFQAIAAKVVQATASASGIARIATQLAVDSATETDTIVTPVTLGARLRAGFVWSSNYVIFPSWLGSLIFQWGTVATPTADVAYDVTFPIAFPNAVRTLQLSWGYVGTRTDNSIVPQIGDQTLIGFKANRQDAYTASSVPNSYINYFAIGH